MVLDVRRRIGASVFQKVAGSEGPARRDRIHGSDGPRWFAEDRPIRTVHGDASMFVGGLRALLLQSLHPLAMAGVAGHSGFRGDPWGRLQRTSYFLAVTTFGLASDADKTIARIRKVHSTVTGVAPDGREYAASDPHLLEWVHLAEVDSFLAAHQKYGRAPLDQDGRDAYVLDASLVARKLGVIDPPVSEASLRERLESFRSELVGTPEARSAARFLLLNPPLPLIARAPYAVLGAASVALLPRWARRPLRLPYLPVTEATVVRTSGAAIVRGIRWATSPPA
jgi:uncharacterized protein (DUF2236 family)